MPVFVAMNPPNERLREVFHEHTAYAKCSQQERTQIDYWLEYIICAIQAANLAVVDLDTHVVVPTGELTKIFNYAVAHGYRSLEVQALLTTKEPTT